MKTRLFSSAIALAILISLIAVPGAVVQADAATPPAAPTGLTATGGDTQMFLDWNNSTEPDLAGYNVYRSTTSGGPYTKVTSTTVSSYTDTSLTNGVTYYYVVTAFDSSNNESAYSNEASDTPHNPHYLYSPTSSSVSLTAGDPAGDSFYLTIGLAWNPNPGWWVQTALYVESPSPFTFSLNPSLFYLNGNNNYSQTVKVTVSAPSGATSGSRTIKAMSVSTSGPPTGVGEASGCSVTISVVPAPTPTPTPPPSTPPPSTPPPSTPTPTPIPTPPPSPPPGSQQTYTPVASPVTVDFASVRVTFSKVTVSGTTWLGSANVDTSRGAAKSALSIVDIGTTASYEGSIEIAWRYNMSGLEKPEDLKIMHFIGTSWVNVTTSVDITNNVVYGRVSSLSPFLLALGGCFIATAAYGSSLDNHVDTLRNFRDQYLETNPLGSTFVSLYYKISPPMADFIEKHPTFKPIVRVALLPAVAISSLALKTTLAEKITISASVVLFSAALALVLRKRILGLRMR